MAANVGIAASWRSHKCDCRDGISSSMVYGGFPVFDGHFRPLHQKWSLLGQKFVRPKKGQFFNPSRKISLIGSSTEACVVDTGQVLFQLAQGLMAFNAASNICIPEDQST